MKPPDAVQRDLVRQWIEKAEQDLAAAEVLLKAGIGLRPVIAFHSQQAAEKFLKAILVRHQVYFAKTHDLGKLLDQITLYEPVTAADLEESIALTPYGVEVRYPGDAPELLPGEEVHAVEIARQVRDTVTALLTPYLTQS